MNSGKTADCKTGAYAIFKFSFLTNKEDVSNRVLAKVILSCSFIHFVENSNIESWMFQAQSHMQ